MHYNKIGNAGAAALRKALEVNKTLISLDLNYNNIDAGIKSKINALLKRNVGYELLITSAKYQFETAGQPNTLGDLRELLEQLIKTRDSLDIAHYPKAAIGYQKIDISIRLLEATREVNLRLYDPALEKLSSVKPGQPYFKKAQDGLIEVFNHQMLSLHKPNETKKEAETRVNILQKTLNCLDENNASKAGLLAMLEEERTWPMRVKAGLTKTRTPEEINAILKKGAQECPALFCYSWKMSPLSTGAGRPRSESLASFKFKPS